jgi:hypothetical protein
MKVIYKFQNRTVYYLKWLTTQNYSGAPKLTLGKILMLLIVSFDNDLYRLIDDSNNNWACLKKHFHYIKHIENK